MNPKVRTQKLWQVHRPEPAQVNALARELEVSPAVATVYLARGITGKREFDEFSGSCVLYDPFLLPDMQTASDRLVQAFNHNEQVLIFSDSDVDGLTTGALLTYGIQALTGNDPYCHVPDRTTEGFGLSVNAIEAAARAGVSLVISGDCGVEAHSAALRAEDLGIDLIITDHHQVGERGIPRSVACVNPARADSIYPFKPLAGVTVAMKLLEAVSSELGWGLDDLRNFLPLVAIGTVADCVPLLGENRTLVQQGLVELDRTYMPGLRELIREVGAKSIDTESISFALAPCLNSATRLGRPHIALQLLLETEPLKARAFASALKQMNDERKRLQRELEDEALATLPEDHYHYPFTCVAGKDWHRGIIGLVASRMVSEFNKPALVAAICPDGIARGSGRSVPGCDLLKALGQCADVLLRYGGHSLACGYELRADDLERFEGKLFDYYESIDYEGIPVPVLATDAEIPLAQVNLKTVEQLQCLAPWGNGNPRPVVVVPDLVVASATALAKGKHLKLILTDSARKKCVTGIWWGAGDQISEYSPGCCINVACSLGVDAYQSNSKLLLTIEDISW